MKPVPKTMLLLLVIAIVGLVAYAKIERKVPLTFAFTFDAEKAFRDYPDSEVWYNLQKDPDSYYLLSAFQDYYHRQTGGQLLEDHPMDFERYAYVICFGYDLIELTYNHLNVWGRVSGAYPRYYGRVVVAANCPPNAVNVYRMNKGMYIEPDAHNLKSRSRVVIRE